MTGDPAGEAPASSLLLADGSQQRPISRECLVEVTVPVYNEQKILAHNIRRLHSYLTGNLPFHFVITIADNASTDGTCTVARQLSAELPQVRTVHLDRKGRGLALAMSGATATPTSWPTWTPTCPLTWTRSSRSSRRCCPGTVTWPPAAAWRTAPRWCAAPNARSFRACTTCCCVPFFLPGSATPSAGSRPAVLRSSGRCFPRSKTMPGFSIPNFLILAQRKGLRIYQVPVAWTEGPDSKVDIAETALADLRGVARLRFASLGKRGVSKHSPGSALPHPSAPAKINAPEQPR